MTNRTWNLRDLRNAVLKKHGKKVYVELSPCLNSIVERQEYARFHFHEAKASLEAFFKSDHSESDLFRLVFGKGGDGLEDYEDSKFRAQAHTVACLQSLHSVVG